MKKKLNLLIAGPLPPPAGGISIHIWRLMHLLEDEFNIDFIDESSEKKEDYYNIRSFAPLTYFKKIAKADVFFIQGGSRILKKMHILLGRLFGKKVIITIHGYGARRNALVRNIDAAFFRMAHKIILVNPDILNKVPLPEKKCVIKNAFLPPVMKLELDLPPTVSAWINKSRSRNQVIICANASRLDIHKNQDLYGLDMTLEVCKRLVEKGMPVSFIYTVSALDAGADLFEKGKEFINSNGLRDNFFLIHERLSFVRLIENADIVLRPTNTDGDALTVREAIYLGKKIVASDVVERPAGTVLFKTRNIDDLELKLGSLIQTGMYKTGHGPGLENEDYKKFYVDLVNSLFFENAALALA